MQIESKPLRTGVEKIVNKAGVKPPHVKNLKAYTFHKLKRKPPSALKTFYFRILTISLVCLYSNATCVFNITSSSSLFHTVLSISFQSIFTAFWDVSRHLQDGSLYFFFFHPYFLGVIRYL